MLGQIAAQLLSTLVVAFAAGIGFRAGWRVVDFLAR